MSGAVTVVKLRAFLAAITGLAYERERGKPHPNQFSAAEISLIVARHGRETNTEIGRRLGRSASSIGVKVHELRTVGSLLPRGRVRAMLAQSLTPETSKDGKRCSPWGSVS